MDAGQKESQPQLLKQTSVPYGQQTAEKAINKVVVSATSGVGGSPIAIGPDSIVVLPGAHIHMERYRLPDGMKTSMGRHFKELFSLVAEEPVTDKASELDGRLFSESSEAGLLGSYGREASRMAFSTVLDDFQKAQLVMRDLWSEMSGRHEINVQHFFSLLDKCFSRIELARGKELVCLAGNPGSGKNTLMNYLLADCRYSIESIGWKRYAKLVSGEQLIDISHGVNSKSIYPHVLQKPETNHAFCSFLCFENAHETEEQLCAAVSAELLRNVSGGIKSFLIIIEKASLFEGRGLQLKSIAKILKRIINNEDFETNDLSLRFIITKADEIEVDAKEKLEKYIADFIEDITRLESEADEPDSGRLPREQHEEIISLLKTMLLPDRTLVPYVFDEGKSRADIHSMLDKATLQNKSDFKFITNEGLEKAFFSMLSDIADRFLQRKDRLKKLNEDDGEYAKIVKELSAGSEIFECVYRTIGLLGLRARGLARFTREAKAWFEMMSAKGLPSFNTIIKPLQGSSILNEAQLGLDLLRSMPSEGQYSVFEDSLVKLAATSQVAVEEPPRGGAGAAPVRPASPFRARLEEYHLDSAISHPVP